VTTGIVKWHKVKCGTHRVCAGGVNWINVYPDRRWLAAAMNHATSDGFATPVTIEEAKEQALDAIRKKLAIAVKAFGGAVTWLMPICCGACKKFFTDIPLLVRSTDGAVHEFCPSCSDALGWTRVKARKLSRSDDPTKDVDRLIARKRKARRKKR